MARAGLKSTHRLRGLGSAAAALLVSVSAFWLGSLTPIFADQVPEYQVKAAFLLNFTKFVDWPASAVDNSAPDFNLCILGNDPFDGLLDDLVAGETVGSRKIIIRRSRQELPNSCRVVFVSHPDSDLKKRLANLGPGILTVGDGDGFLRDGGMIAFVVENRHVRFDVNQAAANRAQLRLSSKLLSVARSVEQ